MRSHHGVFALTEREREVIDLRAQGYTLIGTAEKLFMQKCSITNTLQRAYKKLGIKPHEVRNWPQEIARAMQAQR